MSGAERGPQSGPLPPWLWFWLVVYAFNLPRQIGLWRLNLADLFFHQEMPADITGTRFAFLLRLANMPELLPSLALFAGILGIFVPWLRAGYLERRFHISEPQPTSPALAEISDFVHAHAPGIHIKANLLRTDQLAFVYPLGYRRPAIALFGGLIKLWRSDRPAAEAALLHEVAHYRHGDAFIMGAGSFFETVVRHWLPLSLMFCLLPQCLVFADQTITFFQEGASGISPLSLFSYKTGQFLRFILPGMLLQLCGLLFWMASAFILPLAAIWCAELNADRFAVNNGTSPSSLVNALDKLASPTSWWRWLLFRLSHPPVALRRWVALHAGGMPGIMALLLCFPAAYLVRLLALLGRALSGYLSIGRSADDILDKLSGGVAVYLKTIAPIWLAIGGVFLLWPLVAGYRGLLFCGQRGTLKRSTYTGYLISAGIMVGLSLMGYSLRFLD